MIDNKIQKLIELGIFTDPSSVRDPGEKQRNRFGRMIYGHKTAGQIEILTKDTFEDTKRYYVANRARSAVKNFSKNVCA
jgi:hypothetical protein